MSESIRPVGQPQPNLPVAPARAAAAGAAQGPGFARSLAAAEAVSAGPPPEVLASLDNAARVLADLSARQVELHFAIDESSNRVHVEVKDSAGNLIRRIPATEAVSVLAGGRHGSLLVDALG